MLFLSRLFLLLCAHALTDYALQPDFMAKYKHPKSHVPASLGQWWWMMGAHALLNGGGVALITGQWFLGVAETVVHFAIDTFKCLKKVDATTDQLVHLASKCLWAWLSLR